jgi:hypothetical protein
MNIPYIIVSLIVIVVIIAVIIYHHSGRNLHDSFIVYDSVTLSGKTQIYICTFHDRNLFDPDMAARRAKRAGYRLATYIEARDANAQMKKPTPKDDLYFLIGNDEKGKPDLVAFIKRTGFTTDEQLRAPKFVALVKVPSVQAT